MDLLEAKKYLLDFTRTKSYEALCVFLNDDLSKLHSKMEAVRDQHELGILQGSARKTRQLLQLEKEVVNL